MKTEKKLTKKNIQGIYEAKMRNALCFVEKTKDTDSIHTNGITVYINKEWAVVSRMYVRTVYSSESVNYHLLKLIVDLQKQKDAEQEMSEENEGALRNGIVWIQSLVCSDAYSDFDLAFSQLRAYLEHIESKLKEIEESELPTDTPNILAEMVQEQEMKEQLKKEIDNVHE